MALLTVRNKLDQQVASDKKPGGLTVVPLVFGPLESLVVGDNEVGPTMTQQINNGILQITSSVPNADAGQGFVADMDLTTDNARVVMSLDAGEFIVLERFVARVKAAAGVTVDASISIGITGPGYDDIVEKQLAQCRAVGNSWVEAIEGKSSVVNGPAEIYVRTKVPATATNLVADIFVFGSGDVS